MDAVKKVDLPVILWAGEDGLVVAEVPLIPGCISQGATREEALANVKEAAQLCLENRSLEGWDLPPSFSVEHIEVVA
jgi:predicted RNase H-like HicB family nuclease